MSFDIDSVGSKEDIISFIDKVSADTLRLVQMQLKHTLETKEFLEGKPNLTKISDKMLGDINSRIAFLTKAEGFLSSIVGANKE